MATLTGITWDHPRGYRGLFAATLAFQQLRPDIEVRWEKHSLGHFESHPIAELADQYDLIVLDHPFMGDAHRQQCLVDLGQHALALDLDAIAADVVGQSFETYRYGDGYWALPIDASCQMAAYRPDLMARVGRDVPTTHDEVRELARTRRIAIGLAGVHSLMTLFSISASLGAPPSPTSARPLLDEDTGLAALTILREIASWCPREALDWNSIATLEAMSQRDDLVYCPYVFGFSTYSAPTTGQAQLRFTNIPSVIATGPRRSVIGGTGLAISRRCRHVPEAIAVAGYLLQRDVQKSMAYHGAQPARRSVWLDDEANRLFDGFYRDTLETIEGSFVRPRYAGYINLQNAGGEIVEHYIREGGSEREVLARLNQLHEQIAGQPE